MRMCAWFWVLFAVASMSAIHAAEITIDRGAVYQTITGFGTTRISAITIKEGPFYVTKPLTGIYDSLVDDLGVSAHRILFEQWDASRDHENPSDDMVHMAELYNRGVDAFFASYLGPPGYMKDNGSASHGGHVLPEWYDSLGGSLVDFARYTKRHTGADYAAMSIQNEALFPEPYASAVYTPLTYRNAVAATARAFRDAGVPLRLIGPEHVTSDPSTCLNFSKAVMADSAGRSVWHAVATHGYGGDASSPSDDGASTWGSFASYVDTADGGRLQVWMTETSGYVRNTWGKGTMWEWTCNCIKEQPGGMGLAVAMLNSLKHGRVSLWCYLDGTKTNSRRNDLLIDSAGPTILYHVSKHFYRYIRPGAVQIASSSDDSSVLVVAFRDETRDAVSIVLINKNTTETTVRLSETSGAGLPGTFRRYVSTRSLRCEETGEVSAGDDIHVPDSSVVTLYAGPQNPLAMVVVPGPGQRRPVTSGADATGRVYRLDGRLMFTVKGADASTAGDLRKHLAPGAYVQRGDIRGRETGIRKHITVDR